MSGKREENKLVPKLRFPAFREKEGWQEKILEQICDVNPSVKKLPERFVYIDLESVESGALLQKKIISLEKAPSRAQRLLKAGDVIFQTVRPYQKNNYFFQPDDRNEYVASTGYAQLRACESNTYLYQYIHIEQFVDRVLAKCSGSNYPAISSSDLAKITVEIPDPDEQQKIADCLSSLDDLITAQSQKIDLLKAHKKGLMQQLFPGEGETVPKFRFHEFIDTEQWQFLPIGIKIDFFSGFPFKSAEISENPSGTRLLRGINITEGKLRHTPDIDRYYIGDVKKLDRYKVQIDDLVIGMDGSKVGKNSALVSSSDDGALLVQRVARLRSEHATMIRFIYQQINSVSFHSYVDRINTSSGIPHISADQIKDFSIYFPPNNEELQKITDCLTSIDQLINSQDQRFEALNAHKKGLIQQLFPSINATEK